MLTHRIFRVLLLALLLVCTGWILWILWTIVSDPLHVKPALILPALCCTVGFLWLDRSQKRAQK